ncbi:carbohydrate-binding protein, partial [Algibacter mikhailovii]|uniref:carbohydrate-binding protein n=1 Tax=Algibacter mikhailovii TaxID=425498 RepID=UPI002494BAAC
AENFDYSPVSGVDRIYHDLSSSNSGGVYRTDESVDITTCSEGGYALTDIQEGEWITYTVNVPSNGTYDIGIRYASTNANGKIKFNFSGLDVTSEVTVPFGGVNSTGLTDWKDLKVGTAIPLEKGVQAMKVLFSGSHA